MTTKKIEATQYTKENQFFIAITKRGIHSAVVLGVMDGNEAKMLLKIDKTLSLMPKSGDKYNYHLGLSVDATCIFSKIEESSNGDIALQYVSRDITYQQFKEAQELFAQITLQSLREAGDGGLEMTTLEPQADTDTLSFVTQQHFKNDSYDNDPTAKRANYLSKFGNNCRHTARELLQRTAGKLINEVSSNALRKLPHSATRIRATSELKPSCGFFYSLPCSPDVFKKANSNDTIETADNHKILRIIYKRMQKITQKAPGEEITHTKFTALKNLYKSLVAKFQQPSLQNIMEDLRTEVSNWKNDNEKVIKTQRAPNIFSRFFSRKTTTEKMAESLVNKLNKPTS